MSSTPRFYSACISIDTDWKIQLFLHNQGLCQNKFTLKILNNFQTKKQKKILENYIKIKKQQKNAFLLQKKLHDLWSRSLARDLTMKICKIHMSSSNFHMLPKVIEHDYYNWNCISSSGGRSSKFPCELFITFSVKYLSNKILDYFRLLELFVCYHK